MKVLGLNHVALHVTDVDRSKAFYRDVLGLRELPRPKAFTFPGGWFALGPHGLGHPPGNELHLIGDRESGATPGREGSRGRHFAIQVERMDDAVAHLRERGVTFRGPGNRGDGALQLYVQDPDGYVVELCDLSAADPSLLEELAPPPAP